MSSGFSHQNTVFRDAIDPILIEDLEGHVLEMNAEAERAYGFRREELLGQPIKRIVPPDWHEQADDLLARCRSGETVRSVEGVRLTKDGRRIPVLLSLSLLRDETGTPTSIASFAKDLTALRETEKELRQLTRVFRDGTDPIVIEDLEGRVLDMNAEAERAYGFSWDELLGEPIKRIVPPDRHDQADELLQRCRAGEEVRNVEGVRITRDGQRVPVLLSLSLLRNDDGTATSIASFAKDISELRIAEEELRQLTRVYRDAADPIILEDLEGIVTEVNQAAENLYGWRRDELVGQPIKKIVPVSRHWQADELLSRCRAGEVVRDVEGLRVRKDGTVLPVLITLSLLSDDQGNPTGIASFAKDIGAQKQAEAELKQLAEQLEARVQSRTAEIEEANRRLVHELAVARELSNAADREHEAVLLGDSIAIRSVRESIEVYAQDDEPLLLVGPSGAGHEAVARAIHRASRRASRPFIYVDITSVGDAEASLFSTSVDEQGDRGPGKVSLADGGTLYLQGIDRLSEAAQASLLQVLRDASQAREAGNAAEPDVRIIAFTNRDLMEETRQGRFHVDLERLIGHRRLTIPALAERREDILEIANRIILIRARSLGKVLDGLTSEAENQIVKYSWPGNLEELQSVLERAVVLAQSDKVEIPTELLREGPKVGSYTLVRQLGAGAMGEVWLARHALLARPAAVKLIRRQALNAEKSKQEQLKLRFQREARATAGLSSPHTVELYDFGVGDDGSFFYVMEYLTGIDLQSLVTRFGPLSPSRAIHLLRQACLSLSEAHDAGLVHRDVKPSNLFTCKMGKQRDFLKVLDFGVVRLADGKEQENMTATGQLTGTPTSMAPEVVQGVQVGAAADVYGLGCVAYWLLTGRPVFEADNVMALLMQHATRPPDPPSKHAAGISRELDELVLGCLAKDPAQRIENAWVLRSRLATIPLSDSWNEDDAERWWHQHLSDVEAVRRPNDVHVADTLDGTVSGRSETISDQSSPDK